MRKFATRDSDRLWRPRQVIDGLIYVPLILGMHAHFYYGTAGPWRSECTLQPRCHPFNNGRDRSLAGMSFRVRVIPNFSCSFHLFPQRTRAVQIGNSPKEFPTRTNNLVYSPSNEMGPYFTK